MNTNAQRKTEAALTSSGESIPPAVPGGAMVELEKQLTELAASPHFVPLMGSFRDLLETERRRNRTRLLTLTGGLLIVLILFIWGPFYMIRSYIMQSERRMASERQSLERVERALNESMIVLADASHELHATLETYRQPAPVAPSREAASLSPSAPTSAVTAVAAVHDAPPPTPAAVTNAPPAASSATHPLAAESPVQAPAASQPVSVAAAVEPASVTNATLKPPTPVPARQERLSDVLADVERTVQAIRQQRAAATNAAARGTP